MATTTWLSLAFCLLSLTTSCAVRSISSTGRPYPGQNTTYAGELNDLDVVGRPSTILTSVPPFTFTRGARILLVQSGAMFPDDPMLQGVAAHFSVGSASGIPSLGLTNAEGMRAAAQRGGYDAVVAYWGVLESRTKATADSVVTMWLPMVNLFAVDESQELRLRVRIVVLDVRSGTWRTIEPPPITDERLSSQTTRLQSDADQVETLKALGYPRAVDALLAACTN